MIRANSFEKAWILESVANAKQRGVATDPLLMEKNIYALHLLELISTLDFSFVFKGGTALILLFGEPTRFSIDIDIQTGSEHNSDHFLHMLQPLVGENKPFIDVAENKRKFNGIPKRHFKFFYESQITEGQLQYILLDTVFESPVYSHTQMVKVKNALIDTYSPEAEVCCPSVEAILGDKLTAFASNTTGIPLEKETEVIKQMFDVANLTDCIDTQSIGLVRLNFISCANQNLAFRNLSDLTHKDVLADILNISLVIFMNGKLDVAVFNTLLGGIKKIRNYIHKEKYIYDNAVRDAGKVSNIALSLLDSQYQFEKYDSEKSYTFNVEPHYVKRLNQVAKVSKEAYFYWGNVLSHTPSDITS